MAASKKKARINNIRRLSSWFIKIGIGLTLVGLFVLFLTFTPILVEEVKYALPKSNEIVPIDSEFGIVIPKLGANAKVIANVDPYNARAYQQALTKGVAHARGTSIPGGVGNVFLFAHSSEDFYNAIRYNSIFYLLTKLEPQDEIELYYKGIKFTYVVTEKKMVAARDVSFLTTKTQEQMLTLMTCWPPGTTFKRLLIFADLKK